jgi:hypothetical protein
MGAHIPLDLSFLIHSSSLRTQVFYHTFTFLHSSFYLPLLEHSTIDSGPLAIYFESTFFTLLHHIPYVSTRKVKVRAQLFSNISSAVLI